MTVSLCYRFGSSAAGGSARGRWSKVQYTLQHAARVGALPIVAFSTDRLVRKWIGGSATPVDVRLTTASGSSSPGSSHTPCTLLYPTVSPWFGRHDDGACVIPGGHGEPTLLQDSKNASNTRRFATLPVRRLGTGTVDIPFAPLLTSLSCCNPNHGPTRAM